MRKKEEELTRKILNYFRENPDAGDTLEGIANWWLDQAEPGYSLEEVAKALDTLLQKGYIRVIKSTSGLTIYKLRENSRES